MANIAPPLPSVPVPPLNPRAAPPQFRGAAPVPVGFTDAGMLQRATAEAYADPRIIDKNAYIARAMSNLDTPIVGGLKRFTNFAAPSLEDQGNPLFALGPVGELAGPLNSVGAVAGKALQGALDLSPAKAAGSFAESMGLSVPQRVAAQAIGKVPEESRIEGGLASRIGAKGSLGVPGEGAGPAQTAAQKAGVAPRYVPDVGKTRSLVKDTTTGETLPQIFTNPTHAADAAAEAARRNALTDVGRSAVQAGEAAVPKGNSLRDLTTPQLTALHGVTTDPQAKQAVEALLGERAFAIAPEAQMSAALQQVPRDIGTQVRRALRTKIGADLNPDAMLQAPNMPKVLDDALDAAKVEKTPANRTALAQSLIDQERARNLHNVAAGRIKPTGVPVLDQTGLALSHVAGDVRAGVEPSQTFSDAVDAITRPVDQLTLPEGPPAGGAGVPPTSVGGNPPTPPIGDILKGIVKGVPELAQTTRALVAGGDFSAAGRQAFPTLFSHPFSYAKGVGAGFLDIFKSPESFAAEQLRYKTLVEQTGISAGPDGLYLAQIGGNITKGEERFAGLKWIQDKIPALENIPGLGGVIKGYTNYLGRTEQAYVGTLNAVRTYSLLGSVNGLEWALRRSLDIPERQAIAKDINIITGRGFKFPTDPNSSITAVAKLANGLGFSPQNTVARARLITDTPKAMARVAWDLGHGNVPEPGDIEFLRNAAGYVASVMSMWAIANTAGLKIGWDPAAVDFGKIDLGPATPELGAAATIAEFVGFSTQTYSGKTFLDPGQGVGQDIRLLYRLLFQKSVDSKGHLSNPWQPKFGEDSALDLILNFTENKLNPAAGAVVQGLKGRSADLGDPTQNPVTSLLIPLWIQSGLQAGGATQPGGPAYISPLSTVSGVDAEKQRLGIAVPNVPELNQLPSDRQAQFADQLKQAQQNALTALIAKPEYQAATDAEKQILYSKASNDAGAVARKAFGMNVALNGNPQESGIGAAIASAAASSNLDRARTLSLIDQSGKLSPEAIARIDAGRKQTDPVKPNYDLSVADYLKGAKLTDAWLTASAFIYGNKDQWTIAARGAELLRKMAAEDERKGIKPSDDPAIQSFYDKAPQVSNYYTITGSRISKYVGPARQAIEQDPLWSHFSSDANKAELPKQ